MSTRPRLRNLPPSYEGERAENPQLVGKVRVSFHIGALGNVMSATVARSTLANTAVEQCLLDNARQWVFPTANRSTEVTVPFDFKPPKN